jgi:protein-disulfide isomerase
MVSGLILLSPKIEISIFHYFQILNHLSNKLRFVFRNFPITQIHPHAQHAAEAAESAAVQNKFWDMHDHLYEHQQAFDDNHLEKYASELGLNLTRFNHDMSTRAHTPYT